MHVGLIGHSGPDMFQTNIGDGLVRMGHRVSYLGSTKLEGHGRLTTRTAELAMTAVPEIEARYHRRLVLAAFERECEAVITTDGTLAPDAVAAIRRNRIPVALWFPDCVANMGRQRMLTAPYTALFFKDPMLVARLHDMLGLPVWYLPEACNPRWHRPFTEAATERVVVVVGNSYPSRTMLLRRLHEAGIPLRIYGSAPPRWARTLLPAGLYAGHPVFRKEKARVFRGAAAVLNNLHPAEMDGTNQRLFEATASGGAVLCERRPALADLYDTDTEVLGFSDFDELVDRASMLLDNPGLTSKIGDAGSARAHAEHTYEVRLRTLLDKLA